jgi:hypothetical protein
MLVELERQRRSSARLIENLASKLGTFASRGSRIAGNAQRAAHYVQSNSWKELVAGLEHIIRRRPGTSLLVAAAAGLLTGWSIGAARSRSRKGWDS